MLEAITLGLVLGLFTTGGVYLWCLLFQAVGRWLSGE